MEQVFDGNLSNWLQVLEFVGGECHFPASPLRVLLDGKLLLRTLIKQKRTWSRIVRGLLKWWRVEKAGVGLCARSWMCGGKGDMPCFGWTCGGGAMNSLPGVGLARRAMVKRFRTDDVMLRTPRD